MSKIITKKGKKIPMRSGEFGTFDLYGRPTGRILEPDTSKMTNDEIINMMSKDPKETKRLVKELNKYTTSGFAQRGIH